MCPRNCLVAAAWWMLRETEVANARLADLTIDLLDVPVASLTLPVSKADQEAQGTKRKHACACRGGRPRVDCPAHALWDQKLMLARRFADKMVEGQPPQDSPPVPSRWKRPDCGRFDVFWKNH